MLAVRSKNWVEKTLNFPERLYRIDDASSRIHKLAYALLEIGLGSLETWFAEMMMSESLGGTKFDDLDTMFSFVELPRLPGEHYDEDPYGRLTSSQWSRVQAADAEYRVRVGKFLRAMSRGGTLEGLQLIAEAASGQRCQVFELWRIMERRGMDEAVLFSRRPALNSTKEIAIIPLDEITDEQRAAIIRAVQVIKPVNVVVTVFNSPSLPGAERDIRFSASDDFFYEIRSAVQLAQDAEAIEIPTTAFISGHDRELNLNQVIRSATAFQLSDQFMSAFASLVSGIDDQTTVLNVSELRPPPLSSNFLIRIDDEFIEVLQRTRDSDSDDETRYVYTVIRGVNAPDGQPSVAANHNALAEIFTGIELVSGESKVQDPIFGEWQPIPRADSPDNYPEGAHAGDPSKYDASGRYMFEWESQQAFEEWFKAQIETLGGEVDLVNHTYRLPMAIIGQDLQVEAQRLLDALGPSRIVVRAAVYPEGF